MSHQVLDECSKQISDATGKQQGKIDELNSEIRFNPSSMLILVEVTSTFTLNIQEAEGNDCEARDEDQDS